MRSNQTDGGLSYVTGWGDVRSRMLVSHFNTAVAVDPTFAAIRFSGHRRGPLGATSLG